MVILSFLVMVALPIGASAWYLWTRAADQYASFVGFSVRTEEAGSALNSLLGPLDFGGGQTPDADILYEFIQSQDLVARLDDALDLRAIWSLVDPEVDPVFAYHPPGTIEDLRDHWWRKVHISYDNTTGLIELRVLAFTPDDARRIAEAIAAASTELINGLSVQARDDAIGYAGEELEAAVARLKEARRAVTEFRNRNQIVDPTIDVEGQAGLLSQLNAQLAQALIDLDMLTANTRAGDPRIEQAQTRILVIEQRIDEERRKLGIGGDISAEADAFATLVGEYESLVVDREFAEQTYTAALAAYDAAQAEARRQSRYLAVHLPPTTAEAAEYPQRLAIWALVSLFSILIWAVVVLIAYSLRDRR
ncbi:MAG: capsule biosynthesis protein [Pseudomonadota bacterium]